MIAEYSGVGCDSSANTDAVLMPRRPLFLHLFFFPLTSSTRQLVSSLPAGSSYLVQTALFHVSRRLGLNVDAGRKISIEDTQPILSLSLSLSLAVFIRAPILTPCNGNSRQPQGLGSPRVISTAVSSGQLSNPHRLNSNYEGSVSDATAPRVEIPAAGTRIARSELRRWCLPGVISYEIVMPSLQWFGILLLINCTRCLGHQRISRQAGYSYERPKVEFSLPSPQEYGPPPVQNYPSYNYPQPPAYNYPPPPPPPPPPPIPSVAIARSQSTASASTPSYNYPTAAPPRIPAPSPPPRTYSPLPSPPMQSRKYLPPRG
ncbi:ras and Rab interactor 2-like [Diprion similis]|uniref:ras and Rab interactor 2-like n=1 Tax=Diprion similis TaxID=362088 RepID=UPI001EF91572|nr:ras and Rab interactor 2-like [Diprion similis]